MEAFLGTQSAGVWETLGMGCLEGMSPVSDIATSLVMIQECWRDVVAIVTGGLQQIPLQGVGWHRSKPSNLACLMPLGSTHHRKFLQAGLSGSTRLPVVQLKMEYDDPCLKATRKGLRIFAYLMASLPSPVS